ncbi:Ribosomal protein L11 methyltransferase [hydrothermal vent metagenome]|uniref:Ribosomal protein L11 methyltransferase n=1 Tax=hydrothermal vent metagenome TaxID=652676 RepID=A0A3B0TXE7_9ZZZZ
MQPGDDHKHVLFTINEPKQNSLPKASTMTRPMTRPMTRQQAFALVDAISAKPDLALSASAFEGDNGEWVFEATCDKSPDITEFAKTARLALGGEVGFSCEKIDPNIDWVSKSLAGLPAVNAGGFYIHASHNGEQIPAGAIAIHIEAAQAFGTGHHETTTSCLEAIFMALKTKSPKTMIDVGSGSGVLAIALAKRLNRPVIASDIDPVAVQATLENARLNNVASLITAIEAQGLEHNAIDANAPFDLIVANILAKPLTELAPTAGRLAAQGAAIILSGILTRQAASVIAAYTKQQMALKQRFILGQWTTLLMEKL